MTHQQFIEQLKQTIEAGTLLESPSEGLYISKDNMTCSLHLTHLINKDAAANARRPMHILAPSHLLPPLPY